MHPCDVRDRALHCPEAPSHSLSPVRNDAPRPSCARLSHSRADGTPCRQLGQGVRRRRQGRCKPSIATVAGCGAAASPIIPVNRGFSRPNARAVAARRTAAGPGGSAAHLPRHLSTRTATEASSDSQLRIGSGGSNRAHRIERIGSGGSDRAHRIGRIGASASERVVGIGRIGAGGSELAERADDRASWRGRIGWGGSESGRIGWDGSDRSGSERADDDRRIRANP